jgi:hypothetical protein
MPGRLFRREWWRRGWPLGTALLLAVVALSVGLGWAIWTTGDTLVQRRHETARNRQLITRIDLNRRWQGYRLCREVKGINGRVRHQVTNRPKQTRALLRLFDLSPDRIEVIIRATEKSAKREIRRWGDIQCNRPKGQR